MLELFHYGDSPCSLKVRICLIEKGLDYTGHFVDLLAFEHLRPDYLELNPNGCVPTLVHNGVPIIESSIINEYLEEAFPEPSLTPSDPASRARMRVWVKYCDDMVHATVRDPTFNLMIKQAVARLSEEEVRGICARHPDPVRAARWFETVEGPVKRKEIERAQQRLAMIVERLDGSLSEAPWLAGDAHSLADISIAGYVDRLEYLGMLQPFMERPAVADWVHRVQTRPAYRQAVPEADKRLPSPKAA